jgi:hypothetical protein
MDSVFEGNHCYSWERLSPAEVAAMAWQFSRFIMIDSSLVDATATIFINSEYKSCSTMLQDKEARAYVDLLPERMLLRWQRVANTSK